MGIDNILLDRVTVKRKKQKMVGPQNYDDDQEQLQNLLGLGKFSARKSYYPELQEKIEELKEERDRAQNYLDIAGVMFVALNAKGEMTLINRKGSELLGYEQEEIIGKNWFENLLPARVKEDVRIVFDRVMAGEIEPVEYYETPILTKGGEERIIAWHNITLKDDEGNVIGTLSSGEDITKRKRTEESLKLLQRSIETIQVGVTISDRDGKILYTNPAEAAMHGYTVDELMGQDVSIFAPDKCGTQSPVEIVNSRETWKRESVNIRKDGSSFPVQLTSTAVKDAQGELIGLVTICEDITERKRMEEMMIQTEKMMSVGGLAAGMAHEINNPLSGMLQSAQNILRRTSPELEQNVRTARECGTELGTIRSYLEKRGIFGFIESIRESGERAAQIVVNMLNFSRRSESKKIPVSLSALIDRTVELASTDYDLKKQYDFRHIRIEREYDPGLPDVPCVETEISQVLLNLLRNAAQSMTSQEKRVEVPRITLRTCREGDMARIEVEDNGPGMDETVRKRLFEPFFTTREVGAGTGLGLSVSYFIITNNHQGAMRVESTEGKGSKFIIHLPFEKRTA